MSQSSPRRSEDSFDSGLSPVSQRSAYPFPRNDNVQRAFPANTFRRGSTASVSSLSSIANSIAPSLHVQTHQNSTVREGSQNCRCLSEAKPESQLNVCLAIANLVSPANGRLSSHSAAPSSTYRAPTTRDIPPVTLTNIPHIEPSAFREYLSRIGPLFENLQRGRAEHEAAASQALQQETDARAQNDVGSVRPTPSRQG